MSASSFVDTTLLDLPDPCLQTILWFLRGREIGRLSQTCRRIQERLREPGSCDDGSLWRHLLSRQIAFMRSDIQARAGEAQSDDIDVSTAALEVSSSFGGPRRAFIELSCGILFDPDPEAHHKSIVPMTGGTGLTTVSKEKGWAMARSARAVSQGTFRLRMKRLQSAGYFIGVASPDFNVQETRSNNSNRWTLAASGSLCCNGFWASANGFKMGDVVECTLGPSSAGTGGRSVRFAINGAPSCLRADNQNLSGINGRPARSGDPAEITLPGKCEHFYFVFAVYSSCGDEVTVVNDGV
jgi:F-box-like